MINTPANVEEFCAFNLQWVWDTTAELRGQLNHGGGRCPQRHAIQQEGEIACDPCQSSLTETMLELVRRGEKLQAATSTQPGKLPWWRRQASAGGQMAR